MTELEKVREFFKGDVYATLTTGAVIEEIGDRYSKCSLALGTQHKNAAEQVMGGAIFTLADFAFAVATNRPDTPITVTLSTNISFVGTVKGNTIFAQTRLVKDGRRNCFYEVKVTDDLGNLVAIVNVVGAHLN